MTRRARPSDIDEICASLPETVLGTSWGDRPTWKVPTGPKGKGFVIYRAPHKTAVDPDTGEMWDDVVVIRTPDAASKQALVDDADVPFFTIDHFNGYNAVLARQSRLGELSRDELAEVITEAWLALAPKRLAKAWLAEGD